MSRRELVCYDDMEDTLVQGTQDGRVADTSGASAAPMAGFEWDPETQTWRCEATGDVWDTKLGLARRGCATGPCLHWSPAGEWLPVDGNTPVWWSMDPGAGGDPTFGAHWDTARGQWMYPALGLCWHPLTDVWSDPRQSSLRLHKVDWGHFLRILSEEEAAADEARKALMVKHSTVDTNVVDVKKAKHKQKLSKKKAKKHKKSKKKHKKSKKWHKSRDWSCSGGEDGGKRRRRGSNEDDVRCGHVDDHGDVGCGSAVKRRLDDSIAGEALASSRRDDGDATLGASPQPLPSCPATIVLEARLASKPNVSCPEEARQFWASWQRLGTWAFGQDPHLLARDALHAVDPLPNVSVVLIGSDTDVPIRLRHPELSDLSRSHAEVEHVCVFWQHYFYLRDVGSRNGTWFQGHERLSESRIPSPSKGCPLQPGDMFRLGRLAWIRVAERTATATTLEAKPVLHPDPSHVAAVQQLLAEEQSAGAHADAASSAPTSVFGERDNRRLRRRLGAWTSSRPRQWKGFTDRAESRRREQRVSDEAERAAARRPWIERTYGKGAHLVQSMGWQAGQGLGADGVGRVEPLQPSAMPAGTGLGYGRVGSGDGAPKEGHNVGKLFVPASKTGKS